MAKGKPSAIEVGKLTWARTVIGGQTKPCDFEARHGDEHVGRIESTPGRAQVN